jgi:hypothetical protein
MDKVITKSLVERMRDHLACYWKEGDVAPQLTSIELMLMEEAADELAAQKEQYRVLEDEMLVLGDERNKLAEALRSCMNGVQALVDNFDSVNIPCEAYHAALKQAHEALNEFK